MRQLRAAAIALAWGLALVLGAAGVRALGDTGADAETLRAALRRPALQLRRVDFVGTRALEPDALWQAAGIAPGLALVDVDPEAIEAALAANPRIARVRATRLPPDRLVVGVTEREPVALDAQTLEGIDAEGARFALEPAEQGGLPLVSGDVPRALEALAAARARGIRLARVHAAPSRLEAEPEGESVRLVLSPDPAHDLESWLQLRASGLLARHAAREVDLRFEGSAVLRDIQTEGESDGSRR
jgi:hypothetical protein